MASQKQPFRARRALVTGASGGIGEALAVGLARGGSDLVLVARSADKLEAVAARVRRDHGVRAEVLVADLSTDEGVDHVITSLADSRVDIVVANAGLGSHGDFADDSEERNRTQIALNITAVTRLVHAFLPGMLARGVGGVMTVASTAAFQPTPGMGVYGATKAFVLSLTEAIWQETRGRGVRVLALCPGPTETGFFDAAGSSSLEGGRQTAEQVAAVGLRAFARAGGPTVVSGLGNTVIASAHRFVPRGLMARMSALYTAGD
jgi:short-subunit dehydrogenase